MSLAGHLDLTIDQGATFRARISWATASGDPIAPQAPAAMELRTAKGVLLLRLEDGSGLTLNTSGWVDVHITPTQTADLTPGGHKYDLFVNAPSGDRARLVEGKVTVRPRVTLDEA